MAMNVEALKSLFYELGGDDADVAEATTIVDVLNAISAKYDGVDDAKTNAEAVWNIADVAYNISGGGGGDITQTAPRYGGEPALCYLKINSAEKIIISIDQTGGDPDNTLEFTATTVDGEELVFEIAYENGVPSTLYPLPSEMGVRVVGGTSDGNKCMTSFFDALARTGYLQEFPDTGGK